jgi:2-polyprenyl-3-methyl-5-hydroxy-6-metoxy-1,4-benzoquinol methylase
MDEKSLYEKQYKEKKLINATSFKTLRSIFKTKDLHREDLALSLLDNGERLLDVGCGSGTLMIEAKAKFREVHGVDISPFRIDEAVRTTKQLFPEECGFYFAVCNINKKIDYPEEMFDSVTCIAVIEHIFDPYFVLNEIHRVLKPKGKLIVEVPNIAYIHHRIRLLLGRLPITSSPHNWKEIGWDGGHLHYFTVKEFCILLRECGFEIIKVRGSGLFANIRGFYPSLLTGDICVKAIKC